jgi:hypothetical protein
MRACRLVPADRSYFWSHTVAACAGVVVASSADSAPLSGPVSSDHMKSSWVYRSVSLPPCAAANCCSLVRRPFSHWARPIAPSRGLDAAGLSPDSILRLPSTPAIWAGVSPLPRR